MFAAGAAAVAVLVTGLTALVAGSATAAPTTGEDDAPPYAIETFEYPNAAKILKEQGITLRKGDGRIVLGDCLDPAFKDIQVSTSVRHPGQTVPGRYCFKVTGTGKSGYLALEVPKVYNVMTGDVAIRASLTADKKTESVNVGKNDIKGFDSADGTPAGYPVLVELRVTG
ncbi:hypothetical protein CP973_08870 [Streptomyces albofaciens JCM 4342]|uniref:hypothetical protein n=1 Tax=Streptomyces albofaciens TaxID=66866 RepID=UPI0012385FDF|nr:hypothetical protein [Streptomyces albofaciens]KAA6222047.1 hypothetical protein CP973_08870 [Streptomyces albofaciens JCM 4342]